MTTRTASSQRTRFRPQPEPSEADLAAVRAAVIAQATADAFAAGSLADAQVILGTAVPGLTTDITLAAPYADVTGASPAVSANPAITVPTGNPGTVLWSSTAPVRYQVSGGGYFVASSGAVVSGIVTGDNVQFERVAIGPAAISVFDQTTGARLSPDFTLTAT